MRPISCVGVLLLLLTVSLRSACAAPRMSVRVAADASYTVILDGDVWLASAPTSVTVGGVTYTSADGSLVYKGATDTSGSDGYGSYTGTTVEWSAEGLQFVTAVRNYASPNIVVFSQAFPQGAEGTATKYNQPSSSFPAFNVTETTGDPRGYLSFQGRFIETSHAGAWGPGMGLSQGGSGGPFVLFNGDMSKCTMVSPSSEFMAASLAVSSSRVGWGLLGSVTSVPKGFSLETIIVLGEDPSLGITGAVENWGKVMRGRYGKDPAQTRAADFTLSNLGFSTDNGAYYYYNTARYPNGTRKNYEETLLDVHAYAKGAGIPYKYALLDSWWYQKGEGGGVKNWTAQPNIFPDGAKYLADKTGWKFQAHNRMWSADNIYAKVNGGKYDFITEKTLAIPNDQGLWDDLMTNASAWGMVVYEQDWMYNEFEGLNATLQSASMGRDWLIQMGKGATKAKVTIQYCMTYARMLLQTLEIPAVSQFRASDDYHPGQTQGCHFPYCVYYIGTTSLFAHALGLAPSKDNFWSIDVQPGSPYGNETIEPYAEMQAAILSYSTGPVAPSDDAGMSNVSIIMRTCTSDGTLLQPSRPATAIDACFLQAANVSSGPIATKEKNYPVMSTHTLVSGMKWAHILAIGLNKTFSLSPSHIAVDISAGDYVAWTGYGVSDNVTVQSAFSSAEPITIPACGYGDFGLYHASPVIEGAKAILLGEVAKWVPVSVARMSKISVATSGALEVEINGAAGEKVELVFADATTKSTFAVGCTLSSTGKAVVSSDKTCTLRRT